jgi:hypothetical protein
MNSRRDEEIAASVGAHRDLGSEYDDAIGAGLVERIGAEIDRRVDERIAQYQRGGRPAAGHSGSSAPAVQTGRQISWRQVSMALGSMGVGAITSASINTEHGNGTWPIIVIWIAISFINMAIFSISRPSRRDRRSPH